MAPWRGGVSLHVTETPRNRAGHRAWAAGLSRRWERRPPRPPCPAPRQGPARSRLVCLSMTPLPADSTPAAPLRSRVFSQPGAAAPCRLSVSHHGWPVHGGVQDGALPPRTHTGPRPRSSSAVASSSGLCGARRRMKTRRPFVRANEDVFRTATAGP